MIDIPNQLVKKTMRNNTTSVAIPVLAALFLCACGEIAPKFSNVPAISFRDIRKAPAPAVLGDSVIVAIDFEDGDGDIGVQGTSDTKTKDFFSKVFKQFKGRKSAIVFDQSLTDSRLPVFKPDGRAGSIEGTISYGFVITPPPFVVTDSATTILPNDTISFEISIADRSGNRSNPVTTDKIVVLSPR